MLPYSALIPPTPCPPSRPALQLLHEVAHAVVASTRDIKVGPSFLIPNSQLGTFGSVTQFKSLVRNRTDLFDFAAAGLGAGGAASLLLFLVGLAASHGGTAADVRERRWWWWWGGGVGGRGHRVDVCVCDQAPSS